jgi:cation:H+ antiporter
MDISLVIDYLLFLPGFYLLIKGADILVDGASSLAKRLKVSDLVIGLTIVALGTSAPELAVNISASYKGQTGIAISNVLGSNIANILLILGVSSIIRNVTVKENTVWKEIPFSLLAAIIVFLQANDVFFGAGTKNQISRNDGLEMLAFFIIFLYYIFSIAKEENIFEDEIPKLQLSLGKSIIYIIIGLILLPLGSDWVVNGAVRVAKFFGISEAYIGLTIVAIGTSLPEMATSIVALYKKNSDISIGNVVGSNIFNVFLILGISSVIRPLEFSTKNNVDVVMTVLASLILFFSLFVGKKHEVERSQGILFLLIYIIYLIFRAYIDLQNIP